MTSIIQRALKGQFKKKRHHNRETLKRQILIANRRNLNDSPRRKHKFANKFKKQQQKAEISFTYHREIR